MISRSDFEALSNIFKEVYMPFMEEQLRKIVREEVGRAFYTVLQGNEREYETYMEQFRKTWNRET